MEGYSERYYTRFEALFCWFVLVGGPLWALAAVLPSHRQWDVPSALQLVTLLLFLCAVCSGAMVAAFPVRIGSAGIRSYDMWGRYFNVPWDEVERVETRNYVGFPFLRIASKDGRAVLLTLWIQNPEGFTQRVTELAGPENPLTEALECRRVKP